MYHFDELTFEQKEKFKEFKKITSSSEIDVEAWCKITDENPYLWHTDSYFPDNFLDDYILRNNYNECNGYINELKLLIENRSCTEREILNFISNDKLFIAAAILKSFTLFGHHDGYIFKEFELPPHYVCDYLIVAGRREDYKEKTYRKVRELSKQNIILTHYDKLLEEAEFLLNSGRY